MAARPRVGTQARRVRADRARRRLGRGRDAHDGGAARRRSGSINGSKIFITNAGTDITACVTITARTGDDEISNIVVPNGTPGYTISPPMHKLGWRASDTRELSFENCAVPEENLLGPRGEGFQQFLQILDGGRISVAAMGVGLAQGAYDLAYAYAKEREQFGKPIAKFQAVQFKLADMATEIEAGRALVYKAAWLKDQGREFAREAAMAKLYTGELSQPRRERGAADPRRLRLHGGVGDRAALPRPEDPRDRRGHERGAAHGHREAPRALTSRSRPLGRLDRDDLRQPRAAGGADLDGVAFDVPDERAPERRIGRDRSGPLTLEISISMRSPSSSSISTTEPTPTSPALERRLVDEHRVVETRAQRSDARLEQALLVLRGVVLEVLREVAVLARRLDRQDDRLPARALELGELGRERRALARGQLIGLSGRSSPEP